MEQRDFLITQIEQLGQVLSKILAGFLGLTANGNVSQGIQESNERLQSELDINVEKLITLHESELKDYLSSRTLTDDHLEVLSAYLKEIGKAKSVTHKAKAELYFVKAIELLDMADEITKTMCFNRIHMRNDIKVLLQHNM